MAQQTITQGSPPIVWSTIDDAFQKINSNFTELYLSIGGTGVDLSNISADLIPDVNLSRDLGRPNKRWKDLYLGGQSLYLGDALITADQSGAVDLPVGSKVGGVLIKDPSSVSFGQISVTGQSDLFADQGTGILNLSGSGITITTNPSTDTVTFSNSGVTSAIAGAGINLSSSVGAVTITNSGVTSALAGNGISVSSASGNVTITNSGVTSLLTDPGSGISLSTVSPGIINISNSAPNIIQPVHRFIAITGQTTLDAAGPNSTLRFAGDNNISLTTDPVTNTINITLSNILDIRGSVFSDDSTLLVDGVNGIIVAPVFANVTGNVDGNVVGDLTGSVFADGPVMMIDGTEGKLIGPVDTTQLRTSETEIRLGAMPDFADPTGGPASNTVAVGAFAGEIRQDTNAIAIGYIAANEDQGDHAIAVGVNSGGQRQASYAAAFGVEAGYRDQGARALALGYQAGAFNQGQESVAIGKGAGHTNQAANSVIINASGTNLNGVESGFYVAPIREEIGPQVLYYNPTGTKEVTWGPVPSGGGGGGGGGDFDFSVAADDSTLRKINSGESVKFIGTNGITTASDSEGNITISAAGVSGLASRTTPSGSTGNIADAATANVTITGFKGYLLYKIQTSAAAWVRIYTSVAARTADSGRSEGVDPSPGAGVIAEAITTGAETVLITPGTIGFNDESSPTTNIELAVTNKSGGSADITVTLTVVKVEN
jgi:hypothetical protein